MRMKKTKYLLGILLFVLFMLIIPNISKATVDYTRIISGNDGSITINLTGLTLDETKSYSFALTTKGSTPSTWHNLTDYTSTTAKVSLLASTYDLADVLKVTDTGALYIKDNSDDSYVLDAHQINLKLPYTQAISYSLDSDWYSIHELYNSIGGKFSGNSYYKLEKISDETIIDTYLKNNKSANSLEKILPAVPTTGYTQDGYFKISKNDGLYIIWIKITGNNCKEIYGAIIHDGLPDATTVSEYIQGEGPKVTSIKIVSPESGTYGNDQTVKIRVFFDKEITGSSVPTLKIQFGESTERDVTNGTIKNESILNWHYIEYYYNIQSGDVGQLSTIDFSGGSIKDKYGNNAILSCPVLTGDITIKANAEGTTTNNTENKDKSNTDSSKDTTTNIPNNSSKTDPTTAKGTIPYTGMFGITLAVIVLISSGIIAYKKYNNLKGI